MGSEPGGLSWEMRYDEENRLVSSINPAGSETKISYEKNAQGGIRETIRVFPNGQRETRKFDKDGRLEEVTDGEGIVHYEYDSNGRIKALSRKGHYQMRYSYDTLDRIKRVEIGDGQAPYYWLERSYDHLGRISQIDTPAGKVGYEYRDGAGMVIRSLPNGVKTFWKREFNGELKEITHGFFYKPDDTNYLVLAKYAYEHGADGRISAIREQSDVGERTCGFGYDTMGRLMKATGFAGREYRYEYDLVGNRTKAAATGNPEQVCAYDWAGRLTSLDGTPCRYDANGNLSEMTLGGVTRQYQYHSDGRLAEVRVDGKAVQYRYDGFGRLVARKSSAGEMRFIPDPLSNYWQPLVIVENDGTRTLVVWDGDAPLALVRNGKAEFLLHDHLGSVRLVADARGGVRRQPKYDPFGNSDAQDATAPFYPGFAGLFRDADAGLCLTLARGYAPQLGTFLQPDPQKRLPSAKAEDCSLYAYCASDSVNFVDRDGNESQPVGNGQDFLKSVWNNASNAIEQFSQSTYNSWRSLHKEMAVHPTASEIPQRSDDAREWLVSTLNRYESEAASLKYQTSSVVQLGWDEKTVVRKIAVDRFMREFSYYSIKTVDNQHIVDFNKYIYNNSVKSCLGDTSLDWWTTIGHSGSVSIIQRFRNDPVDRYFAGKTMWNFTGPQVGLSFSLNPLKVSFIAQKEMPEYGNWYPSRDINAAIMNREFTYNPRYSWDIIFPKSPPSRELSKPAPPKIDFQKPTPPDRSRRTVLKPNDIWPMGGGPTPTPPRMGAGPSPTPGGGGGVAGGNPQHPSSSTISLPPRPPTPSPVGGVYLGGAGNSIAGLGALKGVQLDANGNLVLIAASGDEVKTPPLRIEDVVTIFRSVYLNGEGPTVTIDPNPENPEKAAMIIRHSKATEDTYVGWILYEADRLMKGYTLGVDNITQKDVVSQVPGYKEVIDKIYFGGSDPRKGQKDGHWERFWIVPAAARRFEGSRKELTLLDVPLKLKTQSMKWEKDKLVDDIFGESSPGATAFTNWFTSRYDAIAGEQYLQPPPESGMTKPVPVFAELHRIALITTIAERLRDQGVSLPFWMRDYEVKKVVFEKTTPAMEVTRKRENETSRETAKIFGGVQLSPASKDVKTYTATSDFAQVPREQRAEVDRRVKLADGLEKALSKPDAFRASVPLTVERVVHQGQEYQAAAIPGAATQALNPCRLSEVDLVVPVDENRDIRLVRSFNSFFNPKGPWGTGWALDLPHLQEIRVPLNREGNNVSYAKGYELLTPLNSMYAKFSEVRKVPDLQNSELQVPDKDSPFYGLANGHPKFLAKVETQLLILKDGTRWHFTPNGDLVAIEDGPQVTVYERGKQGQVTSIVALLGGTLAARIDLEYSSEGTLVKAIGKSLDDPKSKPVEVVYTYDLTGHLASVGSAEGALGYGYKGPLVTQITWMDKTPNAKAKIETLRSFDYNAQGQLKSEVQGTTTLLHTSKAVPAGVEASVVDGSQKTVTRYDQQMRPVEAREADGTHTVWDYQQNGRVQTTMTTPDNKKVTTTEEEAGRRRTVLVDGGPEIAAQFNGGGRLLSLEEHAAGGKTAIPLLKQAWDTSGQLLERITEGARESFEYNSGGLPSALIIRPTNKDAMNTSWKKIRLDRHGRPVQISDESRQNLMIGYTPAGEVESMVQEGEDGKHGYKIERDAKDRPKSLQSSWGDTEWKYGTGEELVEINLQRGGRHARIGLEGGTVRKVTQYDGGETLFEWDPRKPGRLQHVKCANGLDLTYAYNSDGGMDSANIRGVRKVSLVQDKKARSLRYSLMPVMAEAAADKRLERPGNTHPEASPSSAR